MSGPLPVGTWQVSKRTSEVIFQVAIFPIVWVLIKVLSPLSSWDKVRSPGTPTSFWIVLVFFIKSLSHHHVLGRNANFFVEISSLGSVIYYSFWHSEQKHESRIEAGFQNIVHKTCFSIKSWLEVTFKDVPFISQLETAFKCFLKCTLFWINIFYGCIWISHLVQTLL